MAHTHAHDVTCAAVTFDSSGDRCAADLYLPRSAHGALPCVVMGHGFTGTKDFAIPAFARAFASAGFAVFAFDYRGFGESEGTPRQVIDVERQRQDFRRAVEHARGLDEVDAGAIAVWGSSLSCSHVLDLAAADRAIAAVIAMVPFLDAVAGQGSERAPLGVMARLLWAALRDVVHGALRLPPVLVPVVGAPGEFATMTEPDAKPVVAELAREGSRWVNAFAPRVAFGMPRYRKGTVERIDAPILFCIARHDQSASPSYAVSIARRARAARVVEYDVGHFGMYVGVHRERAIADQVAFLREAFGERTQVDPDAVPTRQP